MAVTNNSRSFQFWNGISATPPDFNLDAGLYALELSVSIWGTATLQKLLPDGVTYVNVSPAVVANGYFVFQLPAGQYRILLTGITTLIGVIELISRGPIR